MDSQPETLIVQPGGENHVIGPDGNVMQIPAGWELFLPGDPALTRRVKAAGPAWVVQTRRGRKVFTRGIWAPGETIRRIQADLVREREQPGYEKRLAAGRQRREKQQAAYVEDFRQAVFDFLAFAPRHRAIAERLAEAVAKHATPVGSGTVARTERIPIERRAEAAVIAWLRHQTTEYDSLHIPRAKGARRETRQILAARSRELLAGYRNDAEIDPAACPLARALDGSWEPSEEELEL
jgi:hypothetical protein